MNAPEIGFASCYLDSQPLHWVPGAVCSNIVLPEPLLYSFSRGSEYDGSLDLRSSVFHVVALLVAAEILADQLFVRI